MKSKASSPAKVILFGEHFVVYGVKAILCAINKRITVTAETIKENKISIKSNIGNLELEPNKENLEIDSPLKPFYYLANKLIKNQNTGIRIKVESDIPLGVGLGSSSACCVAGAAAISRLFKKTSKEEILELAIEAEKTIFENTSGADCTVCTYGGIMEYDKKNGFNKIGSEPNFHLVIANSKIEHSTKLIVENVKQFKEKNEEKFSTLCDKESKLIEDILELLKNNNIVEIGQRINENQEYLETIGVSNEKLRMMIKIGQDKSFGAKITGAGGGGCIFALTNESNLEQTMNQFKNENYDCFSVKIDFKGLDTF
ncbi:MAG: mevalonate kinase [Nitrosopumilus sp.]|uniref:mevalonate kinase n=1 Tax=Nitrosopumilus sp. TaxID=2024843 RepID=UPI00246F044E|nr:mevalonate kinase [Nitrosopumilus sp.]MDH5430454.1 mevalonate kinase [Nitrosopumilus sp.]MDH5665641.1 mevalonate kinase [Nitrosopumilus sp.]MDH5697187.1 mevalonate kinase [Nitrosopumilus sp.]